MHKLFVLSYRGSYTHTHKSESGETNNKQESNIKNRIDSLCDRYFCTNASYRSSRVARTEFLWNTRSRSAWQKMCNLPRPAQRLWKTTLYERNVRSVRIAIDIREMLNGPTQVAVHDVDHEATTHARNNNVTNRANRHEWGPSHKDIRISIGKRSRTKSCMYRVFLRDPH